MEKAKQILKEKFGFTKFRSGQEEVIQNILDGHDTLAIMPTGGGKSLCFQIPALLFEGTTIVISPLIALMKDQVDNLAKLNLRATFINSLVTDLEVKERIQGMQAGNFDLVYIAPERFYSSGFINSLGNTKIPLVAVDEAHCVSTWGHDFRPSYMRIRRVIAELPTRPIVTGFTATATPEVKHDVVKQLELQKPKIIVTGFDRPNLKFKVNNFHSSKHKMESLVDYLKTRPGKAGIIYAATRKNVEKIANHLIEEKVNALPYHAGIDEAIRKQNQNLFISGEVPIIVATNAFGMGIDKSDLRFVIHFNMPGTIEAYYQEAGRAGRDNKPSECWLMYDRQDRYIQEFFIENSYPSQKIIKEVYRTIISQGDDEVKLTYREIADLMSESANDMLVGSAIKILEEATVIKRMVSTEHGSFVHLNFSKEEIMEKVSTRATNQFKTLEALVNNYSDKIVDTGLELRLSQLETYTGLSQDQLTRALKALNANDLITYQPPFRGLGIKILEPKYSIDNLPIDYQKIKDSLARERQKLDTMESYCLGYNCRRNFLLKYFGDKTKSESCGNCDHCSSEISLKTTNKENSLNKDQEELVLKIFSAVFWMKKGAIIDLLPQVLIGLPTSGILERNFEQLSVFAIAPEYSEKDIIRATKKLTKAGYLKKNSSTNPKKPYLTLSDQAILVLRKEADLSW